MKISKADAVRIFTDVLGIAAAKTWDDKQIVKKIQVLNDEGVVTKDDLKKADKKLAELTKKVVAALDDEQEVTLLADEAPAKKDKEKGKKDEKPKKGKAAAKDDEDEDEDADDDEADSDDESEEEDEESSSDDDEDDSDDEDEDEAPKKKVKGKKDEKPAKKAAKASKSDDDDKPAKKKANKESSVERDEWGVKLGTRTARINAALSDKPRTMAELQQLAKATGISSHLSKLKEQKLIKKTDEGYVRTKEGMKGYDAARAKKLLKG